MCAFLALISPLLTRVCNGVGVSTTIFYLYSGYGNGGHVHSFASFSPHGWYSSSSLSTTTANGLEAFNASLESEGRIISNATLSQGLSYTSATTTLRDLRRHGQAARRISPGFHIAGLPLAL